MLKRRPNNRYNKPALNQSLDRGLSILEAFTHATPELGIRELSRVLSLNKSIVHRLARTLVSRGFLEQNPETLRYRLGCRAFEVGHQYLSSTGIQDAAQPLLRGIAMEHHLNAYLGVLSHGYGVYLLALQGDAPVVVRARPGSRAHLHSTAMGKVLLAAQSETFVRQFLEAAPLPALTPATLTRPSDLLAELDQVRRRGYAICNEENIAGVIAVGAAVRDRTGQVVAAISAAAPRYLLSNNLIPSVVTTVTTAAEQISKRLGFLGSDASYGGTGAGDGSQA